MAATTTNKNLNPRKENKAGWGKWVLIACIAGLAAVGVAAAVWIAKLKKKVPGNNPSSPIINQILNAPGQAIKGNSKAPTTTTAPDLSQY